MKPILFNTEMVKAILDGKKIVTRRTMKIQPWDCTDIGCKEHRISNFFKDAPYEFACEICGCGVGPSGHSCFTSYVIPGDILYVRETWRVGAWNEDISSIAVDFKADGLARKEWIHIEDDEEFQRYWIQSTDDAEKAGIKSDAEGQFHWKPGEAPTRWRPSIHMPKEAARLILKVTGVRVERLQDITCVDAEMEGVSSTVYWTPNEMDNRPFEEKWWDDYHFWTHYPQIAFSKLWNSTIEKSDIDRYGWDANPYVWVISFERISKEEAN